MKAGDDPVTIRADDLLELWAGYCGTFLLEEADADQLRLGLRVREAVEPPEPPSEAWMRRTLLAAGWREGPRDGRWRIDDRGGAFKIENAYMIQTEGDPREEAKT